MTTKLSVATGNSDSSDVSFDARKKFQKNLPEMVGFMVLYRGTIRKKKNHRMKQIQDEDW